MREQISQPSEDRSLRLGLLTEEYRTLTNLTVEDELLLACSSVHLGGAGVRRVRTLLVQPLDWTTVVETSIAHDVSPLLYKGLMQAMKPGEVLVPPSVLDVLQRLYRASERRSRHMYRVAGDLFNAFHAAGVEAIGLKDLQLAKVVYPDPALRPIGDLDILIRQDHYGAASACLNDLGFTAESDLRFTLKYAFGHHFRRPTDKVWVDVQWNLIQREWDVYGEANFHFDVNQMWRSAEKMRVDDFEMLVPKPEEMLFHLCLHLEGHKHCQLILLCDIAEFLRYYAERLDWDHFLARIKKQGAESSVYYVFRLIERLFGSAVPPIIGEIEPAYFQANLFGPLFGNLTRLHTSLDEIRRFSSPPQATMDKFEEGVRRQTSAATQVYRVVDDLVSGFARPAGRLIFISGTDSEKIFPDASLAPFERIDIFILEHELTHMCRELEDRGFRRCSMNRGVAYTRECLIHSVDPVLAGDPTRIEFQLSVFSELDESISFDYDRHKSAKDAARKIIAAKLRGRDTCTSLVPVQLRVVALTPESLLLYLSLRLGAEHADRLFNLCPLLEFFRVYRHALDWGQVIETARRHEEAQHAFEGLSLAHEFLGEHYIPAHVLTRLAPIAPIRLLASARFDSESWGRYTELKSPFLYAFTLLSIAGAKAKVKYAFLTLCGYGCPPVMPQLIIHVSKALLGLCGGKRRSSRRFAFWLEPDALGGQHSQWEKNSTN